MYILWPARLYLREKLFVLHYFAEYKLNQNLATMNFLLKNALFCKKNSKICVL